MSLSIENFPKEEGESIRVDLGGGVAGFIHLVGYVDGDVPIYSLLVDGNVIFSGPAELVMAQVGYYLLHRKIRPGPHYTLEERETYTPMGTRTDLVWTLVEG
ncbi:hypothetical protein [Burkholderia sp. L27(2015)]|uniref:hypothetical protein n=1 Tax=Burkholderia sp. L27(2015) TaxID=1641858 RepID=UPI00131E9FE3|nr:hypothetical protein [Burkholderia sp. L27(2015)]